MDEESAIEEREKKEQAIGSSTLACGAAAPPVAPALAGTTTLMNRGEEKTEIEEDINYEGIAMIPEPTALRSAVTLPESVILELSGQDSRRELRISDDDDCQATAENLKEGEAQDRSNNAATCMPEQKQQGMINEKRSALAEDQNVNRTTSDTSLDDYKVAVCVPVSRTSGENNHGGGSTSAPHNTTDTSLEDYKQSLRCASYNMVSSREHHNNTIGSSPTTHNDSSDFTNTTMTMGTNDDDESEGDLLQNSNTTLQSTACSSAGVPGAFRAGGSTTDPFRGSSTSSFRSFRSSFHSSVNRPSYYRGPDGTLVNAFMVESDDENDVESDRELLKEQVRREIMQEVVQDSMRIKVQVIDSDSCLLEITNKRKCLVCLILFLIVALATAVGVTLGLLETGSNQESQMISSSNNKEPEMISYTGSVEDHSGWHGDEDNNAAALMGLSTLERIRKRGYVNCGVPIVLYGLGYNPEPGVQQGMNIEHCQAIALTALGDSSAYRLIYANTKSRFEILHNNSVDVLTTTMTHTMGRDVYHPEIGSGLSFSVPYLYTGMAFGGIPEYVDCADQLDTLSGNCRHLRVCVTEGSSHSLVMQDIFPKAFTVRSSSWNQINLLNDGTCNVMVRDSVSLPSVRVRANGYNETLAYKIGRRVFSREPLAMVMRQGDDPEWTSLVNSVIELFFTAEAENLTSSDAKDLLSSGKVEPLDTQTYRNNNNLYDRMVRLVAEFGNYAELYERTLEYLVPRDYPNYLHRAEDEAIRDFNNRSSGMMYYFPFGNLDATGFDPIPGKTLERIIERGSLICGIRPRPGFAEYNHTTSEWSGLDVEFCKALNAAIHLGATNSVEFADVGANDDGEDTAGILNRLTVDVIAGERVTLEKGLVSNLAFSSPYYYDNKGQAFAFATRSDDPQFSDFVFWTVMATIYAEEKGITMQGLQQEPSLMPVVSLFGERFKPMFYDSISAVGSYAEIYERGLEPYIPRSGANLLNMHLSGPQQFPLPLN